ncbi:MAG TPA: class I SAM-dependent methyltransferase [Solirubrobacteraceae bacterium]|jgi:SAM-dependent methyltransferase|nr:class I SAM-dependent methyltransferase [Solirubrobacteraceae bacterium]
MDETMMKATLAVDEHHWWYRGRRRVIRAELDRLPLPAGARVLDAGCGSGRTLVELASYGGEVSGIELNTDAAELARGRGLGEVKVGRLEELPWDDAAFDLITCLDVIEHVPDDVVALAELRRVARPGGWLLVTVPAYQALWSRHDEANHHYRRYSRASLRMSARSAGWQIERVSSFNSLLLAPAAAVRLAQRRMRAQNGHRNDLDLGPAWLNDVLERPLALEASWLARGRTLPVGLSLLAVLRRAPAG